MRVVTCLLVTFALLACQRPGHEEYFGEFKDALKGEFIVDAVPRPWE